MNAVAATIGSVVVGYLAGSIPFAFLIVKAIRGIDIRTVGSGNVGATNAGRLLGFRYFLLIFALDVLKGFAPTWFLPPLADGWAGTSAVVPGLPVFVGLATILGHNFPVTLGFKGGKGVATSLGAFLALDPPACFGALVAFVVVLILTRYVSVSSVAGAIGFTFVHFATIAVPFGRDDLPMTIATIAMAVLLIARHRRNFQRIAAGTEPKVPLGGRTHRGG